ncbi:hypothetical protein QZH56_30375 [Streptomyces olivoreticuli]|uniref:hypothetical protein n=1 Tax=Streptomyces olivoreticuli TaxID=68246 RepID=UPI00265A5482|nr:hypothetical protein [Streptomyces olivoreticuli]WKK23011.1 hypothetical protein QZH56_30375 [Streptomyces olivoreticuli]
MSLMKRYAEDRDHLRGLAQDAAQHERACGRMADLNQVFRACEEAARKYAQPDAVAKRFVGEALDEYRAVRRQLRGPAWDKQLTAAA